MVSYGAIQACIVRPFPQNERKEGRDRGGMNQKKGSVQENHHSHRNPSFEKEILHLSIS